MRTFCFQPKEKEMPEISIKKGFKFSDGPYFKSLSQT